MTKEFPLYHATNTDNLRSILNKGLRSEESGKNYQRGFLRTVYPGIYVGIDKSLPLDVTYKKSKSRKMFLFYLHGNADNLYLDEDQLLAFYSAWVIAYKQLPDLNDVKRGSVKPEDHYKPLLKLAKTDSIKKIHKEFSKEFGFSEDESLTIIKQLMWSYLYNRFKDKVRIQPPDFLKSHRRVMSFLIENSRFLVKEYFKKANKPEDTVSMTSFSGFYFAFDSFIVPHDIQFEHKAIKDTYIYRLDKVQYNPRSDTRIEDSKILYKDKEFFGEAKQLKESISDFLYDKNLRLID